MNATDARLRHYLEQMMFIFLGARVPVDEAAEHLAEVESHCIEAGDDEPADPFEHFGDPHDLARQFIPTDRLRRTVISAAWPTMAFLIGVIFVGAMVSIGSGSVSVLELQIGLALSFIWFPVILALPKQTVAPKAEAWARGVAVASVIAAVILLLSLDGIFPSGSIEPRPSTWVPLALVAIPGFLVASWWYHRPRQLATPVPVGVTADIVEDLGQRGVFKDWLQYDMDGNPLPETTREGLDQAQGQYRSVAYDLRRWASESPEAAEEDLVTLRHVGAQALALLAFVAFAGFALAVSPSDTMQSVGKWLIFLAPAFGVYLLIRNFSQRRPN